MLQQAVQVARERKPYQDYSTWQNFLCHVHWQAIARAPMTANEVVCSQLHALKLYSPSEQTSADVAAGIGVAMYGMRAALMPQEVANAIFDEFKARKQFHVASHALKTCGYNRL